MCVYIYKHIYYYFPREITIARFPVNRFPRAFLLLFYFVFLLFSYIHSSFLKPVRIRVTVWLSLYIHSTPTPVCLFCVLYTLLMPPRFFFPAINISVRFAFVYTIYRGFGESFFFLPRICIYRFCNL